MKSIETGRSWCIVPTERAAAYGTAAGRIKAALEDLEPWERGHVLLSMLLWMTLREDMDREERTAKLDVLAQMMREQADAAFLLGENEASGTH